MEKKLNVKLLLKKNEKSNSLNAFEKEIEKRFPLSDSNKLKIINKLNVLLSPSSYISRNKEKKNLVKTDLNDKRRISTIKLYKKTNKYLPNISVKKNSKTNDYFIKTFTNRFLLNNLTLNKTSINSVDKNNIISKKTTTYIINNSKSNNLSDDTQKEKSISKLNINKIYNEINLKNEICLSENDISKSQKDKFLYSSAKNSISKNNSNNSKTNNNKNSTIYNYLNDRYGIFNLSDFNRKLFRREHANIKLLYKKYKKEDNKKIDLINQIKEHNLFSKIQKENKLMKQEIKKNYESFKEFKKNYYLKQPNENTYEGFSKIYYKFNKARSQKDNIETNKLITLNGAGDNGLENIEYREHLNHMKKARLNHILLNSKGEQIFNYDKKNEKKCLSDHELINLTSRANHKVEKLFPDLLGLYLPKILHDNKTYTIKLLYDVFIEFKSLLKFCILFNNDINIHKKGIDFDTFFNCNTKINQQGKGLSKKIFKTLNNKKDKKYLPWGNYIDGMMKMKDPDINNKMDLFFEILDENGDGSLDYNEVYNLSLVSLQRTISQNPLDILKKTEKEKKDQKEVIEILAEFFSKMIFSLVNIDIKDEIPIDILRKKMQEGGEASEYLEMFLCADTFT